MNISIRQLQGFVFVARLGSFTRAAEQLHITQAGLSAMIKDLEDQLDFRLFDRTTRSVSLTRAGINFINTAESLVEQLTHTITRIQADSASERRILTIAVTPIMAVSLFPHISKAFAEKEPSIQLRLYDVSQKQIQPLVESGEVDIGLSIYRKPSTGIDIHKLVNFPLIYIAPRGTLIGPKKNSALRLSKLPDIPLFVLPSDVPLQQTIDASLHKAGTIIKPRSVFNSMQTIIAMVGAGQGAALLPSMVKPLCPTDLFDTAPIKGQAIHLPFYQVSKRGRQMPATFESFAETFKEVVIPLCLD